MTTTLYPTIARPTIRTEEVIRKVAERITPELLKWAHETDPQEEAQYVDTLSKILQYTDMDAFRLAKDLDDEGWNADEELVEILGMVSVYFYEALDEITAEWVKSEGLVPHFLEGEPINYAFQHGKYKGKLLPGKIVSVDLIHGKYTISFLELGQDGREKYGYIIPFEEVIPV